MNRVLCAGILLCIFTSAFAGSPTDALTTCVADKTTGKDRKDLARWVFFAMSAHPEMTKYRSQQVAADIDSTQRTMGNLVTRLLTSDCASEAHESYSKSGSSAIATAFEALGGLAMRELMSNTDVKATMGGFQKYLDQKKMGEVLSK